MSGPGRALADDPRLLAAGAAGFAAAAVALWAFRGLPLGTGLIWMGSLPVMLAGLAFGPASAALAAALCWALLLLVSGALGATVFVATSVLPAALLVLLFLRAPDRAGGAGPAVPGKAMPGKAMPGTSRPLALLGIWPALVVLLVSALGPDGLEETLAEQAGEAMRQSGLPAEAATVASVVRWALASAAALLALPLLLCGVGAQRWLARRGFALAPTPSWRAARVPRAYAALPVLATLAAGFGPRDSATALFAVALCLWVPLFLQGLAVLHGRLRGLALTLFYVVLFFLFFPTAAVVIAIGLFEPLSRPGAPGGAPPKS